MNKLNREQIGLLKKEIQNADAIVIGAGAGLSTSAGFDKKRLFYTQGDYGLFQSVIGQFSERMDPPGLGIALDEDTVVSVYKKTGDLEIRRLPQFHEDLMD